LVFVLFISNPFNNLINKMSLTDTPTHNELELRRLICPYCDSGEILFYKDMGTFECNKCRRPVKL